MAGALGVFLVKTDRTLVDSPSTRWNGKRPLAAAALFI
jgi:hypothetical protein